eukprot:4866755-Alexandrium_andersonii.AAC.1
MYTIIQSVNGGVLEKIPRIEPRTAKPRTARFEPLNREPLEPRGSGHLSARAMRRPKSPCDHIFADGVAR